jgi:hypothetical protein
MRLKIIDINFTTKQDFYVMNESFYKNHNFKSPITKKELDYYDRGQWIKASTEQIDGKGIVIRV